MLHFSMIQLYKIYNKLNEGSREKWYKWKFGGFEIIQIEFKKIEIKYDFLKNPRHIVYCK